MMGASLWILSWCVLISAIFAIVFREQDNARLYAIFKPMTTFLIIVIAILVYIKKPSFFSQMMIPSLIFALIGDVFLIQKKYFLHGLAAFLVAHIGFAIGFSSFFGFSLAYNSLIIIGLSAGLYFYFLKGDLHQYTIPVAIYILVIVVMNWQAVGLLMQDSSAVFWRLAIASLLFSFSDSVIAYKKFKRSFAFDEVWILSTYWLAIFVFAVSGLFV